MLRKNYTYNLTCDTCKDNLLPKGKGVTSLTLLYSIARENSWWLYRDFHYCEKCAPKYINNK